MGNIGRIVKSRIYEELPDELNTELEPSPQVAPAPAPVPVPAHA